MFERFTDRARKTMALANQEAQRFFHEYVGTEHILLGLVKEGSGTGANVLKNLDVDLRKVRLEIEKIVKSGPEAVICGKLPQTPRARKVIELAIVEARELKHNYVGTEHLLLGILREHDGVAAQVLMNLGLKLEEVRDEVLSLLGAGVDPVVDPQINVTAPMPNCQRAAELRSQIAILDAQKDEAIRNAEYEPAARYRDQSDELRKELNDLVVQCDRCPNRANVYIKESKAGIESKLNLCEQCSSALTNGTTCTTFGGGTGYAQLVTMSAEQIKQLLKPDESDANQPLLEALFNVEETLTQLVSVVSDPNLALLSLSDRAVQDLVDVTEFVAQFVKLRDRLLSE